MKPGQNIFESERCLENIEELERLGFVVIKLAYVGPGESKYVITNKSAGTVTSIHSWGEVRGINVLEDLEGALDRSNLYLRLADINSAAVEETETHFENLPSKENGDVALNRYVASGGLYRWREPTRIYKTRIGDKREKVGDTK
ncbi:MAG: hypothetical protein ABIH25_04250 [Candidatus Woesearchaeota archaeon]